MIQNSDLNPSLSDAPVQSELDIQADTAIAPDVPLPYVPLEVEAQQLPYTIRTEGALTYFDFDFEDAGFTTFVAGYPASAPNSTLRSKLLMGTGAVAALAVTGLLISDAVSQPDTSQNKKAAEVKVNQRTSERLPQPANVSPESINLNQSPPKVQSPALTKKQVKKQANQLQSRSQLLAPQASQSPQLATPTPSSEALRSRQSPSNRAASRNFSGVLGWQDQQPLSIPGILPSVSQPEQITNESRPSAAKTKGLAGSSLQPDAPPQLNNATTPSENVSTPNPGVVKAGASSITRAELTQPLEQSAGVGVNADLRSVELQSQPNRGLSDRQQSSNTGSNRTDLNITSVSPSNPVDSARESVGKNPQSIRDYIVFNQQPPSTQTVALMSLNRQAAEEAAGSDQVGKYTVRQVDVAEYQKEWLTSNSATTQPELALGFPAYGFIDYQRQVIVLLRETTAANPG